MVKWICKSHALIQIATITKMTILLPRNLHSFFVCTFQWCWCTYIEWDGSRGFGAVCSVAFSVEMTEEGDGEEREREKRGRGRRKREREKREGEGEEREKRGG